MALANSPGYFAGQAAGGPDLTYVANCYILSGASSVDDFIGPYGTLTYRHDEDSAAPDIGDDLTAGTWADAAEVPFNDANKAVYTIAPPGSLEGVVTTDPGGCVAATPGPYGDTRIGPNDEIVGASWLVRHDDGNVWFRYGKTPNNEAGIDNTSEVDLGVHAVPTNDLLVSEAAGDVPTVDEYFQYGYRSVPVARHPDPTMYDCLCSLLIKIGSRGITLGSGYASRRRDILVG
ncbi:MAG: hypothetical protein KAV00_02015 [Phycisphaerae bacterium]|nr:hypothetical protein [Phycisphaerae bacterium]